MEFYKNQPNQKQINISHIRDMVLLAYIDGILHQKEIELINKIGLKLGLEKEEMNKIISQPERFQLHPPINKNEQKEHLLHLVQVIFVDQKIAKEEVDLYLIITESLGFKPTLCQEMLDTYLEEFNNKNSIINHLLFNQPLTSIKI